MSTIAEAAIVASRAIVRTSTAATNAGVATARELWAEIETHATAVQ